MSLGGSGAFGLIKKLTSQLLGGIGTKGSFAQNLTITFSGNALAQVVGFAFTPFIARFYGPEAYGIFALYLSIANNISPLSTLQFPAGYVVANSDGEFYRLIRITFYVLMGTTAFLALSTYLFSHTLMGYFAVGELSDYLFLIPVYTLLMGLDYLSQGWNIREREFRKSAVAKLISVFSSKLFTLSYAFFGEPIAMGMILGNLILYPINSIGLIGGKLRMSYSKIWPKNSVVKLAHTWNKFKDYPLYTTPRLMISGLSMQLPVFLFSTFFTTASVGQFALAVGVISAPLSILINSSNVVFLQKAAETYLNSPDVLRDITLKLYKRMLLISVPPIILVALTSKWTFSWVFGIEWETSGIMASFIALSAMYTVNGPLSAIFRIFGKQKLDFLLNLTFIGLRALSLIPGIYLNDIILSVISHSFVTWLCSCVSLLAVFRLVSLTGRIILRDAILGVVIFAIAVLIYIYI